VNRRGRADAAPSPPSADWLAWSFALLVLLAVYVLAAVASSDSWFGLNALGKADAAPLVVFAVAGAALAIRLAVRDPTWRLQTRLAAVAAAVLSFPIVFLLRTNVLNADGNMLTPKFEADVPRLGAHLTYDEILELFLHSRVWHYTHQWWGWSVVFSYQVVSCVAGMLFVYALFRLAHRFAPDRTWLFVWGALSGAYVQMFFGDVENYTVTAAIVVFYLLAAHHYLSRAVRLWVPTAVLSVAMCFHLEAAALIPSLGYLYYLERRREAGAREMVRSALAAAAIGGAVIVYFHFHGLPMRRFFSSHAGQAVRLRDVFAIGMPSDYYAGQLALLLLLCPASVLAIPLIVSRRERDATSTFLLIASASLLALQAFWKAQLGVRDDWNLYAIGGMVIGLAIWREVAAAATTARLRIIAALVALAGSLNTYAWIASNHFR